MTRSTLITPAFSDLVIKKSRFIGVVHPINDRPHALQAVNDIRAQHPLASHVCWALMAGGHSAAVDDGEPSGTAGRPMLEVLRHHDLECVVAIVVRYYGGINLGAGGLVRAYTETVAQALKTATKVPLVPTFRISCVIPYSLEGVVRHRTTQLPFSIVDVQRGAEVTMALEVPKDQIPEVVDCLTQMAQGQIHWFNLPS